MLGLALVTAGRGAGVAVGDGDVLGGGAKRAGQAVEEELHLLEAAETENVEEMASKQAEAVLHSHPLVEALKAFSAPLRAA